MDRMDRREFEEIYMIPGDPEREFWIEMPEPYDPAREWQETVESLLAMTR
jgi:hypothetical protein